MNLVPWRRKSLEARDQSSPLLFQQWAELFSYQNVAYQVSGLQQTLGGDTESIGGDFQGLIHGAYRANGIVFACMLARMLHFVQARFMWQQLSNGRPGKLWSQAGDLDLLQTPWRNATTMDLLGRMISDLDLAGNFFAVRQGDRLHRLRPDWTYIVLGSRSGSPTWEPGDPDTEPIGYQYHPGGLYSGRDPYLYLPNQVAHWAQVIDPLAEFRGMSWITAAARDIRGDISMTSHRQKFFDQGATVNHVVTIPAATVDAFDRWVEKLDQGHRGLEQAYKTVYLGAGADMKAIGSDMQQVAFAEVQGQGEVRIANVARVPPQILGINEGLKGSTLNAGNYQSARRQLADELLRPLWAGAAGALASILAVPSGSRLWYDDRDIAFLKEDVKDAAQVRQFNSTTASNLIQGGWEADAIIQAIVTDDMSVLIGHHTGLTSVQLNPPNLDGSGGTMSSGTA